MKHIKIRILIFLLLFSSTVFAQQWFTSVDVGYNSNLIGTSYKFYDTQSLAYNTQKENESYPQGMFYSIQGGLEITKKISLGIAISYLQGNKIQIQENLTGLFTSRTGEISFSGISFKPFLGYNLWEQNEFAVKARVAPILMLPQLKSQYLQEFDQTSTSSRFLEVVNHVDGGIALGFDMSLFLLYQINRNLALKFGIDYNYINWRPSKWENTINTLDVNRQLLDGSRTDYTYNELENISTNFMAGEGTERPYEYYYFQNLGFRVGLVYGF